MRIAMLNAIRASLVGTPEAVTMLEAFREEAQDANEQP